MEQHEKKLATMRKNDDSRYSLNEQLKIVD